MSEITRKADADQFLAHLDRLCQVPPSNAPSWWPLYVYHCTDIMNACRILESREILSRALALAGGRMAVDNASPRVIGNTAKENLIYARFYLRPRTPTQFRNEGFRPGGQRELDAHCPVPVYFLLDAKEVLTRSDSLFTDGNLGAGAIKRCSAADFCALPFDQIYHDSSLWGFSEATKSSIIYHRNAEVLVPDRLALDSKVLKMVWCRSPAEYQTLLNLLSPAALRLWRKRIGQGPKLNLFYGRWTYVQTLTLSAKAVVIAFNASSETPGPFRVRVEIKEYETAQVYQWSDDSYVCNDKLELTLTNLAAPNHYQVSCYLDGHLAARAEYHEEDDEPF